MQIEIRFNVGDKVLALSPKKGLVEYYVHEVYITVRKKGPPHKDVCYRVSPTLEMKDAYSTLDLPESELYKDKLEVARKLGL
jgi:hypothetical protein